jgi:7 transmembrane receptor (rhodopsin family)
MASVLLSNLDCFNVSHSSMDGNSNKCWSNMTGAVLAQNKTVDSTNETSSDGWKMPLGGAIYLITDTCFFMPWMITANILVIVSFFRDPKLRLVQNYYICSLAVTDLLMATFVLPLGLYSFLNALGWPIRSRGLCKFYCFLDYINSLQGSLTVSLISYDRYKMVLYPINYRNEESPKRALMRIGAAWTFSILFYGPVVLFWDVWMGYSIVAPDECDVEFRDLVWLTSLQACVEFGVPLIVICYCNIRLMIYIRMRRKKMLAMRKALELGHTETTIGEEAAASIATVGKTMEKVTEKQKGKEEHQKNAAEIKEIQKEQRAARSLMILVGTFFMMWFWYEIIGNFIAPICGDCVPTALYEASYWPLYHLAAVNPLIYAITIERFRHHFLVFYSHFLPCCVRNPNKDSTTKKNRVGPKSNEAVPSASLGNI